MESSIQFIPFYDRGRSGNQLGYGSKLAISLGVGAAYLFLQYLSLADKNIILDQYCWVLAVIISVALLALYVATDLFRRNLFLVEKLQGRHSVGQEVINNWLTDRRYLMVGATYAVIIAFAGYLFGLPVAFQGNLFSQLVITLGWGLAGFTCGMGMYGIVGVIILYLKLSPCLYYTLDPMNDDGAGGIKRLGDALWFFALLTGSVGLLTSIYLFGVDWTSTYKQWVRVVMLLWLAKPYLAAISIVLIPGMAIRRNVQAFKQHRVEQLRQEQAQVYSSMKTITDGDDDRIIHQNRELKERLANIQQQIVKLKSMRDSHIDSGD